LKGAFCHEGEKWFKSPSKECNHRFEIRPGQANSAQDDESRGAWIYFEADEPIGRSHAQNTELIEVRAAHLGHVYCFGALSYLGTIRVGSVAFRNGRGSCGLFGRQQREMNDG